MKKYILFLLLVGLKAVFAGNPERVGQAGGVQLLINPYARSSGLGGLNVATTYGIESYFNNVAGLAHTKRSELVFANTTWFRGSGIGLNTLGFSQSLGEDGGVLGIHVGTLDFGDEYITTIDNPDGGLGMFSPNLINIGIGYAKEMVPNRIYVGAAVKLIHESIPDLEMNAPAFDGGVQYQNANGRFRLGVSLRNIGPTANFTGDGLTTRANLGGRTSPFDNAVTTNTQAVQLPTVLTIGASYNMDFGVDSTSKRVTNSIIPMFTFVSNAFSYDQVGIGLEYRYKQMLMLRAAYTYEENLTKNFFERGDEFKNLVSGLSLGVSFELPLTKKTGAFNQYSSIAVDYAFRSTYIFNGIHTFGLRFNL